MTDSADEQTAPPTFVDSWKRFFLGKPLISEHLDHESLSNTVALGALSPDAISSTVYGPEQIMVELLPAAGLAAFVLVLPIAGVILLILALVTASYRQVVMTYTQRGGSYVVARSQLRAADRADLVGGAVDRLCGDRGGAVRVGHVCGGVAAPRLGPYHLEITVAALLLMSYANLRGMKEAGRIFAVPVYAFIAMLTVMIVTGVVRKIFWTLPKYDPAAQRSGRCRSIRATA